MPLKVVSHKLSRNLYLRGTVKGVHVYETTGTPDPDLAEEIRIKRETGIVREAVHGPRVNRTFSDAVLTYCEAPGASEREFPRVLRLEEELGGLLCSSINQEALDLYVRQHCAGWKPSTVLRQVITPLTSVLMKAHQRGWCDRPKFERPRRIRGRRRFATYAEAGALLRAAERPHAKVQRIRTLLAFLLYTGARMSEAIELEWTEIDLGSAWCVFLDTKNGEDRGLPLHPCIVSLLSGLPERDGRVFLTPKNEPYADKGRAEGGQIKKAWAGNCARAGIDGMVPHDLRHTFSTWLTMAGVHEQVRDELMGHASTSIGRRYSHVVRPALVDAVGKLPPIESLPREELVKQTAETPKQRSRSAA